MEHLGKAERIVWTKERQYMAHHRPGVTTVEGSFELEGGDPLGDGPFEFRKAVFTYADAPPAVSIKMSNGEWSRPLVASMFMSAE